MMYVLGDYINCVVLMNSLFYAVFMIYESYHYVYDKQYEPIIFSHSVLRDGFCITNKNSVFLSSHALCFYLDTIFSIILWKLAHHGNLLNIPKDYLTPVHLNSLSHFGHGVGHFMISIFGHEGTSIMYHEYYHQQFTLIFFTFLLTLFWLGFMRTIHTQSTFSFQLLESIIISFIQIRFLPVNLGFTYVQTILLVTATINDLYTQQLKKDYAYNLKSFFINFPIGMVGWLEAITCDNFMISFGGHIWYDCTIPISIIVYYLFIYYFHYNEKSKYNH